VPQRDGGDRRCRARHADRGEQRIQVLTPVHSRSLPGWTHAVGRLHIDVTTAPDRIGPDRIRADQLDKVGSDFVEPFISEMNSALATIPATSTMVFTAARAPPFTVSQN
jgi:hypothetical protein